MKCNYLLAIVTLFLTVMVLPVSQAQQCTPDASPLQLQVTGGSGNEKLLTVANGGGVYAAVGQGSAGSAEFWASFDGLNWTQQPNINVNGNDPGGYRDIVFDNGRLVMVGDKNSIKRLNDLPALNSKYPPAKPGALVCEPLKAAITEPTAP